MRYELISVNNCNIIREILKQTSRNRQIEISDNNLELELIVDSVSISLEDEDFINMEKIYFMFEESTSVLKIKNRQYEIFFNIGEWGTKERRIANSHLVLGTNPIRFGSDYFFQIELSQAEKNISVELN